MTTASQLLQQGGAGGPFLTDPRDMDRYVASSPGYVGGNSLNVETIDGSYAATFWNNLPKMGGVASNTAWSAGTYKTLLDVTGRGFLRQVIGPQGSGNAGATSAIRITLDGVPYEISVSRNDGTNSGGGGRQILGSLLLAGGSGSVDPSQVSMEQLFAVYGSITGLRNGHTFTSGGALASRNEMSRLNKVLKYNQNLKVEAKVSVAISVGAGYSHYAAAIYDEAG